MCEQWGIVYSCKHTLLNRCLKKTSFCGRRKRTFCRGDCSSNKDIQYTLREKQYVCLDCERPTPGSSSSIGSGKVATKFRNQDDIFMGLKHGARQLPLASGRTLFRIDRSAEQWNNIRLEQVSLQYGN